MKNTTTQKKVVRIKGTLFSNVDSYVIFVDMMMSHKFVGKNVFGEIVLPVVKDLLADVVVENIVLHLQEENTVKADHHGNLFDMRIMLHCFRQRHDSSSPELRRNEVKEEPLSETEKSPSRKQRRRSDSYSSDDGHNHGKMRSMVSRK